MINYIEPYVLNNLTSFLCNSVMEIAFDICRYSDLPYWNPLALIYSPTFILEAYYMVSKKISQLYKNLLTNILKSNLSKTKDYLFILS